MVVFLSHRSDKRLLEKELELLARNLALPNGWL